MTNILSLYVDWTLYVDLKCLYSYLWKHISSFIPTQRLRNLTESSEIQNSYLWAVFGSGDMIWHWAQGLSAQLDATSHQVAILVSLHCFIGRCFQSPLSDQGTGLRREPLISEPQCDLQSNNSCCRTSVRILCLDKHPLVSECFISADRPQRTSTAVSIWTTEGKKQILALVQRSRARLQARWVLRKTSEFLSACCQARNIPPLLWTFLIWSLWVKGWMYV